MQISASSFTHEGPIPAKHTGDGQDRSPPLSWSGAPPGAKSLVLVGDGPSAPGPAALERAMQGHTLADGELVGTCQRRR